MPRDLSGQVVAVTGASSGIGEATALACARAGASVALAARRSDRIEQLARQIEDEGGRAIALPTDVTDERQARAFVEHVYEHLGRLDVLVCAASSFVPAHVEGADTEAWRQMVRVSLLGVLYCCHAALPVMRAQGFGHIVNVVGVERGMARGAVTAFSDALREEVAPLGVQVSVVEDAVAALA
jgi:NADP-dependent 3-hydroxy acid dehydrogenase YdfG